MEEEKLRRGAIAVVSALIALLFVQPVSGGSESVVTFSDRMGDLGHPWYLTDTDPIEPAVYWPDTSPVGDAGYLDLLCGEMSLGRNGILTATLTVAEPVTEETVLPNSVNEVWWTWFFYTGTGYFEADYAVHLCWDGTSLECVVLVRGQEDPAGSPESYSVAGDQIVVRFDSDLIPGSVAWFAETICWMSVDPHTDLGYMPTGGWYAADISDGPFLPFLSMPV